MKTRTTLILAVIALGLLGYIYLDWKNPGDTQKKEDAQKLFPFDAGHVKRFSLSSSVGDFVFEKGEKDQQWYIKAPIVFPANSQEVMGMLYQLSMVKRIQTIGMGQFENFEEAWNKFELDKPMVKAEIQTEDSSFQFGLGRETAFEGSCYGYVLSGGKKEIVILLTSIKDFLIKNLNDWRTHDIFNFEVKNVRKITIRKEQQEFQAEFSKLLWQITKPLVVEADNWQVADFLNKIREMKALRYVSETESSFAEYGLNTPRAILEIQDGDQVKTLKIGNAFSENPKEVFATYAERPAVFTLSEEILELLDEPLRKLRDRRVVVYSHMNHVRGLDISCGKVHTFVENTREHDAKTERQSVWVFKGTNQKADTDKVRKLIEDLLVARIERFLPDSSVKDSFENPLAVIKIHTYYLSSDQKEPSDHLESLMIGKIEGDEVSVKCSRQASVITLPRKILEDLPAKPWDWLPLKIEIAKRSDIQKIQWIARGESYTVLKKGSGWNFLEEKSPVDREILALQLQMIQELKAVKWVGPYQEKEGALCELLVTTEKGETKKISFLEEQPEGVLVKTDGEPNAFLVHPQVYKTLRLKPLKVKAIGIQ